MVNPSAGDFYKEVLQGKQHGSIVRVGKRLGVMRFALDRAWIVRRGALFLEFGVHEAKDLTRMALFVAAKEAQVAANLEPAILLHGFDSFRGLPEDWDNGQRKQQDGNDEGHQDLKFAAGAFDLGGVAPDVADVQRSLNHGQFQHCSPANIELHSGWFQDTVPLFLSTHSGPIAFVHADADLYTSTFCFLDEMCRRKRFIKGTVIVFDEFWNYPNWEEEEYRAWKEICQLYNLEFDYLCFHGPSESDRKNTYGYQSVAVVVTKIGGDGI